MDFELRQDPSSLETVNEFTKRMESATEEAKSTIHKAQEDMTKYYNRRRSLAPVVKDGIPEERRYEMIDRNYTLFWSNYHKWSLTICDGYFDTSKSSKMRSKTSDKRCC